MNLEQALKYMEERSEAAKGGAPPLSLDELKELPHKLSVRAPEASHAIMLYSGGLAPDERGGFIHHTEPGGLYAFNVAKIVADNTPNLNIVDETPAMKLVEDKRFQLALGKAATQSGLKSDTLLYGEKHPDGTKTEGLADEISRRFVVENADKPVVMLTPFSEPNSVYGHTEFSSLMSTTGGTIEGIPREVFQDMSQSDRFGMEGTRLAIAALSAEQAVKLKYNIDENGALLGVDASEFWEGCFQAPETLRVENGIIVSQEELFEKLTPEQRQSLIDGAKIVQEAIPNAPHMTLAESLENVTAPVPEIAEDKAKLGKSLTEAFTDVAGKIGHKLPLIGATIGGYEALELTEKADKALAAGEIDQDQYDAVVAGGVAYAGAGAAEFTSGIAAEEAIEAGLKELNVPEDLRPGTLRGAVNDMVDAISTPSSPSEIKLMPNTPMDPEGMSRPKAEDQITALIQEGGLPEEVNGTPIQEFVEDHGNYERLRESFIKYDDAVAVRSLDALKAVTTEAANNTSQNNIAIQQDMEAVQKQTVTGMSMG